MSETMDIITADEDTDACEACGALFPIGEGVLQCDCTFCRPCYDAWLEHFNSCDHAWVPETDPSSGKEGRYCTKCAGFVANEDNDDGV